MFQPPRSHTDRIFSSSGEKTTPVAPSMDVAYAGVIPAWSQTYTSSVLSGTAWWKAKPCAASHSTSTAAPRCRHDTAIATKTAALPVGVPPLPLPTSRCSSSARETTARSAAAGTEPLTRTQQLLNGPRCTDSPARSASTAPVAVAPAAAPVSGSVDGAAATASEGDGNGEPRDDDAASPHPEAATAIEKADEINQTPRDARRERDEPAADAETNASQLLRAPRVRRVGFCRNGAWQGAAFEPQCDRAGSNTAVRAVGAFHPSVSLYTHGKVGEHQDPKVAFNFGPTFVFPVSSFGDAPAPRPMCDAAMAREATRGATE